MDRIKIEITRAALEHEDLFECDGCQIIMDETENYYDEDYRCLCPECAAACK